MEDSKNEIMNATYSALCKHGYADLTIEKIAEESEKGKSLIYYHFDDKEDLILGFLDYMTEEMESCIDDIEGSKGDERLGRLFDLLLGFEDEDMWEFHQAMAEIQGRAQYNDEFRKKFDRFDRLLRDEFRDILEEMEVDDADVKADLLLSTVQGALTRKLTLGEREDMKEVKNGLKDLI